MNPHVLLISLHADPASPSGAENAGGTHAYIRELLAGLASRGWEVTMVTRRASPDLPAREHLSRYATINRIQIGPLGPLHKSRLDALHAESVAGTREVILRGARMPDLVHSVYWNSGRVAVDLSAELEIPFVHTVISNGKRRALMGAAPNASRREEVEGWVFGAAFRIFCVSEEERRDLVELYSVDSARLVVVGRPVAECFLDPAHNEMGRPRPLRLARGGAGQAS